MRCLIVLAFLLLVSSIVSSGHCDMFLEVQDEGFTYFSGHSFGVANSAGDILHVSVDGAYYGSINKGESYLFSGFVISFVNSTKLDEYNYTSGICFSLDSSLCPDCKVLQAPIGDCFDSDSVTYGEETSYYVNIPITFDVDGNSSSPEDICFGNLLNEGDCTRFRSSGEMYLSVDCSSGCSRGVCLMDFIKSGCFKEVCHLYSNSPLMLGDIELSLGFFSKDSSGEDNVEIFVDLNKSVYTVGDSYDGGSFSFTVLNLFPKVVDESSSFDFIVLKYDGAGNTLGVTSDDDLETIDSENDSNVRLNGQNDSFDNKTFDVLKGQSLDDERSGDRLETNDFNRPGGESIDEGIRNGFSLAEIIVIVMVILLIIAAFGVGFYFYSKKFSKEKLPESPNTTPITNVPTYNTDLSSSGPFKTS